MKRFLRQSRRPSFSVSIFERMNFFFVPTSIKRTSIDSCEFPLFTTFAIFVSPTSRNLFSMLSLQSTFSGYLLCMLFLSYICFFLFSNELNVGYAIIIYRYRNGAKYSALKLQGKRLLAQETSSTRPGFDTATLARYFDCKKKFNSATPRSWRLELCIICSRTTIHYQYR